MTTRPDPFIAGLRSRCPACGEGPLFDGFSKVTEHCDACGQDFSSEDIGDGPAVFIMSIVGFIVVPLALVLELAAQPPYWLHALLWLPLSLFLCLIMIRPFKAVMFALQFKNDAEEARLEDDEAGDGASPPSMPPSA
ncbi:DUF983 domain-containing protein [Woodsholea maritima]|uniref:DUF983 domain-containing protein n=1 Tax=Woodsholea maritima TaxID=240237 RepID=UPI00035EB43B|nr:DUF983 domain-containing protein [Woodsholea maritima]